MKNVLLAYQNLEGPLPARGIRDHRRGSWKAEGHAPDPGGRREEPRLSVRLLHSGNGHVDEHQDARDQGSRGHRGRQEVRPGKPLQVHRLQAHHPGKLFSSVVTHDM